MSEHIGRETYIEASGKRYKLPRLTRKIREELTAWAVSKLKPDTLENCKKLKEYISDDEYKTLVLSSWRADQLELNFFHPRVEELYTSPEGIEKGLTLLLQAGTPELTEEACIDILGDATYENGIDYLLSKWRQVEGRTPSKIVEALKKKGEEDFQLLATNKAGLK